MDYIVEGEMFYCLGLNTVNCMATEIDLSHQKDGILTFKTLCYRNPP